MQLLHCCCSSNMNRGGQVGSIPKISGAGELNYSFAAFTISYFVVVNWTLLQVPAQAQVPS